MTKREYFNHATVEEQKEKIKKWFLNNYEDPANCCPYEDGEYQYIWGGPYEPREVLEEHFGNYVSEKIIDEVVEELEGISYEWSDYPESDEDELNYYINNSDDPYSNYLKSEREISELLNEKITNEKNLYKMLYAQAISAMEQFLSSYFIMNIKNNNELCIKFINSCDELKKIKLEEFAESRKSLSEYCCKFVLEKIVWHKLKFVKNYYKNVLSIDFPEDIPIIHQGIEKRHHIVHRNGKDYDNVDIIITKDDVNKLLAEITKFIEKIADIRF